MVCAARCGVDRFAGAQGRCGLGEDARVYKEYLHYGEEACLVPSHTIYLTGCNFRCSFCSDAGPVTEPARHGAILEPKQLAARIAQRRKEGAQNVNFVGGLPDVNILYILRVLHHCPADTHVVWNTNLWTTQEAIEKLTGIVGTWLVDYKFGQDRCAHELAGIQGYVARMQELIPHAARAGRLIFRHLLMPGHFSCCTQPVLGWLRTHYLGAPINLMTQFHPFGISDPMMPLRRRNTEHECQQAVAFFHSLGFEQAMVNGRQSSR
jgi:putative pyruvate formate lyase activating enzyme